MVIVDNNVLSSLAKANYLDLLKKCFSEIKTTPEILHEFKDESIIGYDFVDKIEKVKTFSAPNKKTWLQIISLSSQENIQKEKIYNEEIGISQADAECLSVALNRDEILITDDFRLGEVSTQKGVNAYDLETFLLTCAKKKIINNEGEAKTILKGIEEKDFYTFSDDFVETFLLEIKE